MKRGPATGTSVGAPAGFRSRPPLRPRPRLAGALAILLLLWILALLTMVVWT